MEVIDKTLSATVSNLVAKEAPSTEKSSKATKAAQVQVADEAVKISVTQNKAPEVDVKLEEKILKVAKSAEKLADAAVGIEKQLQSIPPESERASVLTKERLDISNNISSSLEELALKTSDGETKIVPDPRLIAKGVEQLNIRQDTKETIQAILGKIASLKSSIGSISSQPVERVAPQNTQEQNRIAVAEENAAAARASVADVDNLARNLSQAISRTPDAARGAAGSLQPNSVYSLLGK